MEGEDLIEEHTEEDGSKDPHVYSFDGHFLLHTRHIKDKALVVKRWYKKVT